MLNFSNLTSFLKRNKKILYYTGFFVMLFFIVGSDVFAIGGRNNPPGGNPASQVSVSSTQAGAVTPSTVGKNIVGWVNVIFIIASVFIGLLTQLVSLFLNPGWINGTIIGLDFYMKDIWILISNVVYFIFALLLIVIAFMNIIGKGDKWELKQALPKFIIGVLMVPFSWFMVQFILSISAILTVSAITLPFDTFPSLTTQGAPGTYLTDKIIPKNCTINLGDKSPLNNIKGLQSSTGGSTSGGQNNIVRDKLKEVYDCGEDKAANKLSIKDIIGKGDSIFSVISIYTYGIFKVDKFDSIATGDMDFIESVLSLGVQGILNIIFAIVMLILLGALGLALFTRGVWLWLYAMFSPVFGLMYFFDKKEGGEGALSNFSFMEFIKLALVPVYVGAALSFGLMFIFVVISGLGLSKDSNGKKVATGQQGVSNTIIQSDGSGASFKLGDINLRIEGSLLGSGFSNGNAILNKLQGGLGSLIVGLLGIVILWMAVMAALKSSKITGAVVEPIANFGKSIGELAMKSPQYAPIFGGMSAQGLGQAGNLVKQHYSNKSIKTGSDWIDKNTTFGNDPASKMHTINSTHDKSVLTDTGSIKKYHDEMSGEIKSLDATLANPTTRKELEKMIHKIYGDEAYNNVKNKPTGTAFVNALRGTNKFTNASDAGEAYFTAFIRNKNTKELIKMFQGGKVVEEGKAGGVNSDTVIALKTKDTPVTFSGENANGTNVTGKTKVINTNIHMAISGEDKKNTRYMATTISGTSYQMDFQRSTKAFSATKLANIKLIGDDYNALENILDKMSNPEKVEFMKVLFTEAKSDINEKSLAKWMKSNHKI